MIEYTLDDDNNDDVWIIIIDDNGYDVAIIWVHWSTHQLVA